ncbi:hypothetical protein A3715_32870 [Oleiphilus sp. HI0009]|nr:hypothetical protein A3715_01320 [Oleiphilus sp. HI0009]KZX82976.1 hypothetical protein A3715_32870 [Oleiphilus sp. HI0009]KZY72153.1 hypothetical protein A3739_03295 [Oleiphilus sp. HI0067]
MNKNLKEDEDKESEADPFTSAELDKIEFLKKWGLLPPLGHQYVPVQILNGFIVFRTDDCSLGRPRPG